jgi:hypothetical protein
MFCIRARLQSGRKPNKDLGFRVYVRARFFEGYGFSPYMNHPTYDGL